ncbi:dihydrofolate reductase family protein [Parapedobacter sp. GCM10030251]|uniref:dihydrofolate reductase family protein n=1 Tax=Parapedobacter sp. GCM10030251 TaxID=3273419 RepID=UPI003614583A
MAKNKTITRKENGSAKISRVRVESFSISLDGYGAGLDQSVDNPLGIGGEELHNWFLPTQTFQTMHRSFDPRAGQGQADGTTGLDDDFAQRGFRNIGAWIIGRNMFGPIRGAWPDMNWKGWWGSNPPYHVPVYVLTHHARPPLEMEGGTTFYFVTEGIHEALAKAKEAANGKDIRIGGGVSIIRQYLRERLIDELHIAITPTVLGRGERLFDGIDLRDTGYECVQFQATEKATHVILRLKKI